MSLGSVRALSVNAAQRYTQDGNHSLHNELAQLPFSQTSYHKFRGLLQPVAVGLMYIENLLRTVVKLELQCHIGKNKMA